MLHVWAPRGTLPQKWDASSWLNGRRGDGLKDLVTLAA